MAGKWRTHTTCLNCRSEVLKTEVNDRGVCGSCKDIKKKSKMKKSDVKVVTKRKSARCFTCGEKINPGEKAVSFRYEAFFHNNNYGNSHLDCVELTD